MTLRRLRVAIRVVALAAAVLAVGGCASPAPAAPTGDRAALRVITTTTLFADMVREVGGDRVAVESLVPKGGEVHTFDPRPSDLRRVAEADLVFVNGLGLDGWLASLVEDTGTTAPVVELATDLPGVTLLPGSDGSGTNPHLWMNVAYGSLYAARIAAALTAADPAHAADYAAGVAAYQARLAALDADAKERLGAIPVGDRTVISFHDAFPYFAAAYGLTVDGTIVSAPGQDPNAGEVARLVDAIRAKGVKAIFAEAQFNDDLARAIADETGATVVSNLYTDSLGDPPADTYESMMRWNVDQVVAALGG